RRARPFDERDDDLMHAGGYPHRDTREALHQGRARGRAAAVHEVMVLVPAELGAEYFIAVDEHDERVLAFERARIKPHVEIRDRDPVFAVGEEIVLEARAAARTGRQTVDVVVLI